MGRNHLSARGRFPLCTSTSAGDQLQEATEFSFAVLVEADGVEADEEEDVVEESFSFVALVLVSLVVDCESSVLLGPFLP